jgi:hypothetical protein
MSFSISPFSFVHQASPRKTAKLEVAHPADNEK